ncbi:hypothetical protein [Ornithinimicrobium pekingense]|uniref:GNAT family N-acetyltransferase n=1 Tax=Ornithinimicrobium pekingense TaxID=384677 RepID=A0ABQ2FA36_9MICO|nr:hypothetical protein [Ornithinimicrobium pekingense]GGK76459.1 hypothetical protein GCM10011509_26360 [Ornithinimicrobium pekingense]
MASLGEESARVRVRRLGEDEAFLLGALHLQALRRRGVDPAAAGSGNHVQALGAAWRSRCEDLPAWVAECDERHVGLAVCRVPVLPHVGRPLPVLVAVEALGAPGPEPVTLALVRAVVTWFGREGYPSVDVSDEVTLPGPVLDAARADVLGHRRVSLPTRP